MLTDHDRREEWLEPDGSALADMTHTLTTAGLAVPRVPSHLAHQLRRTRFGWAWGTDPEINSRGVYSFLGEAMNPPVLPTCLEADRPDFWLFGHRGYGAGSMGFGLLARVGPLFVAQQSLWGGVYMDPSHTNREVNRTTGVWDRTAWDVKWRIGEPLRVALIHSGFRYYASVLVRLDDPSTSRSCRTAPVGWTPLWCAHCGDRGSDLLALLDHPDPVVGIAAHHLFSLTHRADGTSDLVSRAQTVIQSSDDTAVGTPDGQSDSPEEESSPRGTTATPPGQADSIVGLDELVDAIVEPHYDRNSDSHYWERFVELTCVALGLEDRHGTLQLTLSATRSPQFPLDDYLEVPEEIGLAYRAVDRISERLDAIKDDMRLLQREFFRCLLLAMDPTVEGRTTTISQLKELGLPERHYYGYSDW